MIIALLLFIVIIAETGLFLASKGKYEEFTAPLDKKDYPLKSLIPMGLYVLEKVKCRYKTKYDQNLLRKISEVSGAKYSLYYLQIHWANRIAFLLAGLLVVLTIGSLLMLPQKAANHVPGIPLQNGTNLQRPDFGDGDKEIQVEALIKRGKIEAVEEFTVPVSEMPPETEDEKALAVVKEQLSEEIIKGKNKDLLNITEPLDLPTDDKEIGDQGVRIRWEASIPDRISPDGRVKRPPFGSESPSFFIRAILTRGAAKPIMKYFKVNVLPSDIPKTDEQAVQAAKNEISKLLEDKGKGLKTENRKLQLPTNIEKLLGVTIQWFDQKQEKDQTGVIFSIFGLVILCLISFAMDSKLNQQVRERRLLLQLDFPDFLNKLTLLINAGMTVNRAWEKIVKDNKKDRPLYQELSLTFSEIQSGKSEAYAYEDFAKRCGIPQITKFTAIIVQNMKKGSSELVSILKFQANECWEMRKNAAKRLGEEAGTKMLLPMMIMFIAVLIIVALPAVMAMQTV
ncbi:MAG: type II secretion system F family protein [Clostridia bacterium]|nr:type II secretion system F family protein [Clostridia bacterium]